MGKKHKYSKELLLKLYRTIYTIRIFETRCIELYRKALIRGYFHPYLGEEAIAAGACAALREQDYIASTHRGHGHCIARGADIKRMTAELFGKQNGYCGGRGGSMHIADIEAGNLGANGIVAAGAPLGLGAALGAKIRHEDRVAVVFTSDGGVNNGVFSETLNLAAAWSAPMIQIIENNRYAVSTPIEDSTRVPELYKRGKSLGIASLEIDGNDVLEVYESTQHAVELCQKGEGPVLIEAKTYRHGGHHCNDPGKYMPGDKVEYYKKHDPLKIARRHLIKKGKALEKEIGDLEKKIEWEMEEAIEYASASPEPPVEDFLQEVEKY
ncbi:MAG: thiamine pyrophosphate-dependent dehydrogenase E1 component subunit alpha [Candidatus Omnitrophica bacterium]|nr:thiamine pyrophosphate-dependent dehydrogenase E1 component subunit alpha [Candidatus Omnitrophota bacterium]